MIRRRRRIEPAPAAPAEEDEDLDLDELARRWGQVGVLEADEVEE